MRFQNKNFGPWEQQQNGAFCGMRGAGVAQATLWYETEVGTAYRVEFFEREKLIKSPAETVHRDVSRWVFHPIITFVETDGSMRRIPVLEGSTPRPDNEPRTEDEAGYQAWLTITQHAREHLQVLRAAEIEARAREEAEAKAAAEHAENEATDAPAQPRGLVDRFLGR